MFGGDPFDPFGTRRQMRQMEEMMDSMMGPDPFANAFGMFPGFGHARSSMGMLEDPNSRSRRRNNHDNHQQLAAASPFGFGGGIFGNLMQQMQMMESGIANDPHSHVFSQSTMISYDGNGAPKVVQNSVRKSGDVKETRRTVRDGEREEITVGHAIGDREHIIEKKRQRDGKVRKNQKFVNLDEDEAEHFNNEFKTRAHRNLHGLFGDQFASGSSRHQAIENGRSSRHTAVDPEMEHSGRSRHSKTSTTTKKESQPIIEIPDDDEDDDDIMVTYSSTRNGPRITEVTEEDAGSSSKRRKGMFGKYFGNED